MRNQANRICDFPPARVLNMPQENQSSQKNLRPTSAIFLASHV